MQRLENYSAMTARFGPHQYAMRKVIEANAGVATVIPSYAEGPAHNVAFGNGGAFSGGCLMHTGEVLLSPSSNDSLFTFDHTSDTLTQLLLHGETKPAFNDAISVSPELVVLPPDASSYIGLFNPTTRLYTRGPAKPEAGLKYVGGCVMTNGEEVFLAPLTATRAAIYNIYSNTVRLGPVMTGRATARLMPDGRIMCPPIAETGGYILIWDPETDQIFQVNPTFMETRDVLVMPDSRINLVPMDTARGFLLDFRNSSTDPVITNTELFPENATNKFWSGSIAANGDAVYVPYSRNRFGYYRAPSLGFPSGQIFDGPVFGATLAERFIKMVPLLDGRFLCVPRKHLNVGLYTHLVGGQPLPAEVLKSPFYS